MKCMIPTQHERNFKKICYLLLLSAPLVGGCGPLASTVRNDGSMVRHHFGYVREIIPPVSGGSGAFLAREYSSVGLRFDQGVGLGYFHGREERVPPDCRLIFRVVDEQQLLKVVELISSYKEGLCVTVSPE